MHRSLIALIGSFALSTLSAHAEDTKIISIDKFEELFETLDKIPAEDQTQIDIHAVAGCPDLDASDILFEYITEPENQSLILDTQKGYLDIEAMRALPNGAELLVLNREDCSFSMTMTPKITLAENMDAQKIRGSLQQLRKAVVSIVPWAVRPLIPRSLDMGFLLEEGASCQLVGKDGDTRPLENQDLKGKGMGVVISTKSLKNIKTLACTSAPLKMVDMGRGVNGKT